MAPRKGSIPWNKGKNNIYSKETLEKMSKAKTDSDFKPVKSFQKGMIPWNKGIKQWPNGLPKEITDKISKSSKGKKHSEQHVKNQVDSRLRNDYQGLVEQGRKLGKSNRGRKHMDRSEDCKILHSISAKAYWDSPEGLKQKEILSKTRTGKHRPPHVQQILKQNRAKKPRNRNTKPERMMQIALALNGIKFEKHKNIVGDPDIFIEPNICLFVDGDYWHANPNKYHKDSIMKGGKLASEIWANDSRINHILPCLGYFVIRVWVSDMRKNVQNSVENIISMIKQRQEPKII